LGIISKAEDGWSIRRIALRYNISKNSVFNILKKWRQQGTKNANPGAGRRRVSNQEQDALLIQTIREHPFYSVVDAVGEANFPGSARTARRRVKETDEKNTSYTATQRTSSWICFRVHGS
jgi:transposase